MSPVAAVRNRLAWAIRTVLSGSGSRKFTPTPGAPTLLPVGGAAWLVHAEASMMVGGIRALLLQSLHPVAMQGVGEHSDFRSDPLGRLRRTVFFLGTTTYCSLSEAEAAIEAVRRVHLAVSGVTPEGRRYRADDEDLLAWVHATEVDSFLEAFLRYGRRPGRRGGEMPAPNLPNPDLLDPHLPDSDLMIPDLRGPSPPATNRPDPTAVKSDDADAADDAAERVTPARAVEPCLEEARPPVARTHGAITPEGLADSYVAEMATVAERLGVAEPPRSHAELAAVIDGFRPTTAATDLSAEAVYFLRRFPLPPAARLAYMLLFRAAADSLPGWAKDLHGLHCGTLRRSLVRPSARAMLGVMGWALRHAPDPEPNGSPETAQVA